MAVKPDSFPNPFNSKKDFKRFYSWYGLNGFKSVLSLAKGMKAMSVVNYNGTGKGFSFLYSVSCRLSTVSYVLVTACTKF